MKYLSGIALMILTAALSVYGQEAPAPAGTAAKTVRVIGEVTAAEGGTLTVKVDGGGSVTVPVDEKTSYSRIAPGETDVTKAEKITQKDVSAGDRVRTRSRVLPDGKTGPALTVLVMSKTDLAKKAETDRADWQKRGVHGKISSINTAAKEVTLSIGQGKTIVIEPNEKAQYMRYSPDSIKFSDAKPSEFAELKVGDMVRVLGDKNADGTRIKPEAIVSGSFMNVAGTVVSVDATANEVKINNLETKKPMTVKLTADTNLRRLTPMMAAIMARQVNPSAAGAAQDSNGGPGGQGPRAGGPGGQGGLNVPNGSGRPDSAGGGPGGPGGGMRRGGGDLSQMLEHAPAFAISELKPGDALIVAVGTPKDPSRVSAVTMLAGVEPVLASPAAQQGRALGAWNMDVNIAF